jgi:hypothetical protein
LIAQVHHPSGRNHLSIPVMPLLAAHTTEQHRAWRRNDIMITRSLLLLAGASLLAGCVAYAPGPASPGYTPGYAATSTTYYGYGYQPAQATVYTYQQPYGYPFYSPEFPNTGETGGNGG